MTLSDSEMIEIGSKAKQLLSTHFDELYKLVESEISAEMMATSLNASADRELLFHTYHGMRSFYNRLHSYALASDSIIAAREDAAHDDQLGYDMTNE